MRQGAHVDLCVVCAGFLSFAQNDFPVRRLAGISLGRIAILFHSPGRVDDNHVASIKLNAIAGIRQYLCYEPLNLQKLFLRHLAILSFPEPDACYACSRLGAEHRRKAT